MNAIDKARAFALIAEHMSPDKRRDVADALGEELAPRLGKGPRTAAQELNLHGLAPDPDPTIADPVVEYLLSIGLREGDLVRAAGRLAPRLRELMRSDPTAEPDPSTIAALWQAIGEQSGA